MGERAQGRPEVVAARQGRQGEGGGSLHRASPRRSALPGRVVPVRLPSRGDPAARGSGTPRRRAVTLNYNDLLQYAATLLRDNLEVRAALQNKYRWLFVDEFQDTDPIQAEVILLLAGGPSTQRDWTRLPLRPG